MLAPLSRPRSRNNNQTEQYGCAAAPVLDCFSSFVVCVNPATRRARPPCNNNKENKTMRSRRRRSRRAKVKGRGREKTSVRLVIITFAANDPLYFLFLGIIFYYIFFFSFVHAQGNLLLATTTSADGCDEAHHHQVRGGNVFVLISSKKGENETHLLQNAKMANTTTTSHSRARRREKGSRKVNVLLRLRDPSVCCGFDLKWEKVLGISCSFCRPLTTKGNQMRIDKKWVTQSVAAASAEVVSRALLITSDRPHSIPASILFCLVKSDFPFSLSLSLSLHTSPSF